MRESDTVAKGFLCTDAAQFFLKRLDAKILVERLQFDNSCVQSGVKNCMGALSWASTLVAVLALSVPAFASLGGNVNSIEADRARMNASVNVTQQANYAVHEMQSPGGTTVKEFVSPDGNVFAVSWQGQFPPQMQQILGSYFNQYSAAISAQPKHYGHRPLNIQQPGLVIQTGGHMRSYFGRAYVPDMLPAGVKADDIK